MNNYKKNQTYINMAMAWEKEFLDLIQNYESEKITVSYMAEVIRITNTIILLFNSCIYLMNLKGLTLNELIKQPVTEHIA